MPVAGIGRTPFVFAAYPGFAPKTIPELIAYLSSVCTLEPGDVVATGTPAGVGFARTPPRYLQPGDEVIISIEGIGELRNPVVAES